MNKIVLITGAAKGIGKAIALELAKNQYDVVINYLTSKKEALEVQKEIEKTYGVRCLTYGADVSNETEVDKMITYIEENLGSVDIRSEEAHV